MGDQFFSLIKYFLEESPRREEGNTIVIYPWTACACVYIVFINETKQLTRTGILVLIPLSLTVPESCKNSHKFCGVTGTKMVWSSHRKLLEKFVPRRSPFCATPQPSAAEVFLKLV